MKTYVINEILLTIATIVIPMLIGEGLIIYKRYIDKRLKGQKIKDILNQVGDLIVLSVANTNQVYVKELKSKNKFDRNAQKEAFGKTLQRIKEMLNKDAKEIIEFVYENTDEYLKTKIEAEVNKQNY